MGEKIDLMIELQRRGHRKRKKRSTTVDHSSQSEPDDQSQSEPDNQDHVTEIYKEYVLYLAAKNGNLDDFIRILDRRSAAECDVILRKLSPAGNTFLHVAAKNGNEDVVTYISAKKPSLVLYKNFNGETALHVAAKAGDESMVKALVLVHQDLLVLQPAVENERDEINLLRAKNNRGNTALHEALSNGWVSIAKYLIEEDPELSYYENKDGEFALYLAAKAGLTNFIRLILRLSTDEERLLELFKKKSPIQAAIKWERRGFLNDMFLMKPNLVKLRDRRGKTPLHYAASYSYLEAVRYLLTKYPGNAIERATQRDKNGSFPIHLASIKGYVDVISLLLQDCPDPIELLDKEGRNILHIAAENGRSNVVRFILKNPDLDDYINMKDKSGKTPLHLATMHSHPKIVHDLTWDKRVDVKVSDDKGMTALDLAEKFMSSSPRFAESLTWAALKAAGTPRFLSNKTGGRRECSDPDSYQPRIGMLLLVSTLVAMVTFAAGFTVPGGYNNDKSSRDLGMAQLLRESGFHVFVFCDTIALYSSIIVVVVLIWAQLGDLSLVLNALSLTVPLLGIALITMAIAFMAGILIAVHKLRWLAFAVLIMGIRRTQDFKTGGTKDK